MTSLAWLILTIIFMAIEFFSFGLTAIWFAFGSIFAMVASNFMVHQNIQIAIFITVSALSIFLLKPLSKKYLLREHVPTNLDRIIGQIGTVNIEETSGLCELKIDGKIWTVRHIDKSKTLTDGQKVKVLEIKGVKLIVDSID